MLIGGDTIGVVDIDFNIASILRVYEPNEDIFSVWENVAPDTDLPITLIDPAVADIMKGVLNANNNE